MHSACSLLYPFILAALEILDRQGPIYVCSSQWALVLTSLPHFNPQLHAYVAVVIIETAIYQGLIDTITYDDEFATSDAI